MNNIRHNDIYFQYNVWLEYSVGIAATMFNRITDHTIICLGQNNNWINLVNNPKGVRQLIIKRNGELISSKFDKATNIWIMDDKEYPTKILVPYIP